MNSLWALFEIVIPRTEQPPWIHLAFCIFFLLLYLALAYVTHATQDFYTYSFLDPAKGTGSLVGYIFGIFAGIIVLFVIVWLLIWLREWAARRMGLEGKLAYRHSGGNFGNKDNVREPMHMVYDPVPV